jgi:hypothetical protein
MAVVFVFPVPNSVAVAPVVVKLLLYHSMELVWSLGAAIKPLVSPTI